MNESETSFDLLDFFQILLAPKRDTIANVVSLLVYI